MKNAEGQALPRKGQRLSGSLDLLFTFEAVSQMRSVFTIPFPLLALVCA